MAFPSLAAVTGGDERAVAGALEDAGFEVLVLNPRQVRRFAQAKGRLAGGRHQRMRPK